SPSPIVSASHGCRCRTLSLWRLRRLATIFCSPETPACEPKPSSRTSSVTACCGFWTHSRSMESCQPPPWCARWSQSLNTRGADCPKQRFNEGSSGIVAASNRCPRSTIAAHMNAADVRAQVVRALRLDLVGPEPDEPQASEVLSSAPSRWYLTGFLVPWGAPAAQKQNEEDVQGELEYGEAA